MSTKSALQNQITELQARNAELMKKVTELLASTAPAAEKKARKPKKEKDPDAPKRAPTAFFAFSAAQRAAHTGDSKLTAKELGVAWKLLSDEQRLSYKSADAAPPKPKKEKLPAGTVRPPTAFFVFSKAERAAHKGDKPLTAKDLGAAWKLLSDEQRLSYKSA